MTGCGFEIAVRFPDVLRVTVDHFLHAPLPPEPPVAAWVSVTAGGITVKAKGPEMAFTLPNDKQVLLQVEFLDAKGHHATIDGDPSWSSSHPEIATVTVTPGNPFLATLAAVGPPGNVQVKVEADADLGDGVREVLCTMDVTVVGGEAVIGVISPASDPAPPSSGGS